MIRNDTNGGWTAVCRLSSSGTATWTCEVCHLTNLMNWQISNHKPWAHPEIDTKTIPLKILFKVQTCFLTSPMLSTGAGECMPVSASLLSHSHSPCWKDLMKIKHFLLETKPSIIYHHLSWNSQKYTRTCAQSKSFLSVSCHICHNSWWNPVDRLQLVSSFAWCSSCQSWPIFWPHLSRNSLRRLPPGILHLISGILHWTASVSDTDRQSQDQSKLHVAHPKKKRSQFEVSAVELRHLLNQKIYKSYWPPCS